MGDIIKAMPRLHEDLEELLNKHSAENLSNTPDFILASFLMACLSAFNGSVVGRDNWYGIAPEPGCQDHQDAIVIVPAAKASS